MDPRLCGDDKCASSGSPGLQFFPSNRSLDRIEGSGAAGDVFGAQVWETLGEDLGLAADGGDLAESSQRVARSQSTTSSTENAGQVPGLEMPGSKAPAEALEEYRDEEIAIAFDYEMLIDYEVIENLELLELIDTAEFTEQI